MNSGRWKAQNVKDVLLRFDRNGSVARKKYRAYLEEGITGWTDIYTIVRASNNESENTRSTSSWVIGNRDFVIRAMEQHNNNLVKTPSVVSVEEVAEEVCRSLGIEKRLLLRKGRMSDSSKARRIVAQRCSQQYGIPIGEIARYFGVTSSAVSNMVRDSVKYL